MITIYAAMLVTLGFLIAALMVVVLLPAYRRRIERFASETLKRTLPLTEEEIRADKDRLRADFAMQLHRLETKVQDAALLTARQNVEVNRRDAKIQELTEAIADQKMSVDEHENARRVLEQAILDRLPKVEQRLAETRKLLATRDREIKALSQTSDKQAAALDEAKQLNVQREKELKKLQVALDTRAARNREVIADEQVDGAVALRTELESLRAKTREQSGLIEKLQAAENGDKSTSRGADSAEEVKRLTTALAEVESELSALRASEDSDGVERLALRDRIADLEEAEQASSTEIIKLKAALRAYETESSANPALSQKADLSAVQAEVDEQRRIISGLRAELAASQERLARQAQHFHDEVRRVGPASDEQGNGVADLGARKSLAERIVAPRVVRAVSNDDANAANEVPRSPAQLRTVNGNGGGNGAATEATRPPPLPAVPSAEPEAPAKPAARRPRLLERISGLDKV